MWRVQGPSAVATRPSGRISSAMGITIPIRGDTGRAHSENYFGVSSLYRSEDIMRPRWQSRRLRDTIASRLKHGMTAGHR